MVKKGLLEFEHPFIEFVPLDFSFFSVFLFLFIWQVLVHGCYDGGEFCLQNKLLHDAHE